MPPSRSDPPPRRRIQALLPAFNATGFIQPTLDSLSAQAHDDFEVIVSVDRSDDETYALCLDHAARDPRFRVMRQTERLGYVGNCNFLLGAADAEYVLFAFHDDTLAPTYLATLAGALDASADAVLAYSDVELTDLDGRKENWVYTELEGLPDRAARGLRILSRRGQWWVPNRGLFRLAPARSIGGLKTHRRGEFSADWPWLFRLGLLGRFVRVPQVLCYKAYMKQSLSRTWSYDNNAYYEAAASCMREIWSADLTTREKLDLSLPLTRWLMRWRDRAEPVGETR